MMLKWLYSSALLFFALRRREQPEAELHCSNYGAYPPHGEQPVRPPKPTPTQGWHPQEERHRCQERRYWFASILLSAVVAIGAGLSARYAYRAANEAHEQAVQARRQADAAESELIATTRARLKLVAITDAYVSRAKGSDVAWFYFKPTYKNFGPSPAEDIFFEPHIFVVGAAGPSSEQACKTGEGWIAREPIADIVFPQDEGGGAWIGAQVPLQKLKEGAAKIHAIQPSATVYLGVVGCLLYRSGSTGGPYVTGFTADLHPASAQPVRPEKYIPIYDILTASDASLKIEMQVKVLGAWAD